jgi:hypothetical protein
LSKRRKTGWFISPSVYPTADAAAQTSGTNVPYLFTERNGNYALD